MSAPQTEVRQLADALADCASSSERPSAVRQACVVGLATLLGARCCLLGAPTERSKGHRGSTPASSWSSSSLSPRLTCSAAKETVAHVSTLVSNLAFHGDADAQAVHVHMRAVNGVAVAVCGILASMRLECIAPASTTSAVAAGSKGGHRGMPALARHCRKETLIHRCVPHLSRDPLL